MFLPIGDYPNPNGFRAWVTWSLIAVNVAVFVLISLPLSGVPASPADPGFFAYLQALGGAPTDAYALFTFEHGYKPGTPEIADLFSSMFLHGGLAHLGGNMLFLWIFGDNVEHHLGRIRYLLAYLATGVAATLTFAFFDRHSVVPLVGASGAISGVLGFYFLLFPRNRVKVFAFLFPFFLDVLHIPARIVLGIYIVVQNLLPFFLSVSDGVAYGAHVGGFFAGLGLAWAARIIGWEGLVRSTERRADRTSEGTPRPVRRVRGTVHRRPPRGSDPTSANPETLRDAVTRGDRATAFRLLEGRNADEVLSDLGPHTVELAEWLAEAGQTSVAMTLLRRAVQGRASGIDQARVYLALGLIRLQQGQSTAAYQHFLTALDHDPDPATEERIRSALGWVTG